MTSLLFKKISRFLLILIPASILLSCVNRETQATRELPVKRIIMVCLDTFRYDRLREDLAPNLIELARESQNYSFCHAGGSWTLPSIIALFTGKYPSYAGMKGKFDPLPMDEISMVEVLQENGWKTVGISANEIVCETYNFQQGFDYFALNNQADSKAIIDFALSEIESIRDEEFFLYLHMMDPHLPYTPPEPYRSQFRRGEGQYVDLFNLGYKLIDGSLSVTEGETEQIRGLYDAECAYSDAEIGRFIGWLKENELWDGTAFIFFADHGEELGEHNDWQHGHTLRETVMHVPMLIHFPGAEPGVTEELTSLRMIPGLLFDRLHIDAPPQFDYYGISYIEGVKRYEEQKGLITDDRWKIFIKMQSEEIFLYNLSDDPGELNNLWDKDDTFCTGMLRQLIEIVLAIPETGPGTSAPTEEQLDALRALGYITE